MPKITRKTRMFTLPPTFDSMIAKKVIIDSRKLPPVKNIAPENIPIISEVELAYSLAKSPICAVTGTNVDYDYSLVWGMNHGWVEGSTTGTFAEWVDSIVPKSAS